MWCHLFLLSSLVFILFFTHLLIYFSILIFLMFLFLYTSYWFITMLVLYIFPFWNLFFFVCESTFFSFLLVFFFFCCFRAHSVCIPTPILTSVLFCLVTERGATGSDFPGCEFYFEVPGRMWRSILIKAACWRRCGHSRAALGRRVSSGEPAVNVSDWRNICQQFHPK